MKILLDGHAQITGMLLNGHELQQVTNSGMLDNFKAYTIASVKKEYGGGFHIRASANDIEIIADYLSQE